MDGDVHAAFGRLCPVPRAIIRLDEVPSTSARLTALTGDWNRERRSCVDSPELYTAIHEAPNSRRARSDS
jgi:hypothetical protein